MASQHQRQIQQMKAFILQEAAEKRNEINIKVGKEGAPSRRALHSPASLLTRPPPPPCLAPSNPQLHPTLSMGADTARL